MKPSDCVIVIGRQCGCGGRELGEKLAERLGIPFYDRHLFQETADDTGMRSDLLERHDERRPSGLGAWLASGFGATHISYNEATLSGGALQKLQGEAVRKLMEKGSCVIVGRSADYIGRDLQNVFSVFLHAPLDYRIKRIKKEFPEGLSDEEIAGRITRTDRRRCDYYNDFTGRKWGQADNYHLSIDTSLAGLDDIADNIVKILETFCSKKNKSTN